MNNLICPDCGHDAKKHGIAGGCYMNFCDCRLTFSQSEMKSAQRAHALAHLRGIAIRARECAGPDGRLMSDDLAELWITADAYRAIGVLNGPR